MVCHGGTALGDGYRSMMPALPADHKQLNWTCQWFHLVFLYALQWLGEQMRQSSAQDLDQHALTDGFGFDRFVRANRPGNGDSFS
jgi:hypothetical protein